ncbi:MAG: hypothetical protein GX294_00435 [Candidatus Cloacimonetes bacterium]|nr:hypothetical protein [Candidatus Cloacimonadota bacterium]
MINGLITLIILALLGCCTSLDAADYDPGIFWKDDICVQTTVQRAEPDARSIKALTDGQWQEFDLVPFPDSFWEWNTGRRMEYLDIFREMLAKGPEATRKPALSGPHNGIVATYGEARADSRYRLNNAIKGMGLCPTSESIDELLALLTANKDAEFATKIEILDTLYQKAQELFSPYALVSLELYSQPDYNTQTFINQMTNPLCVTVFLDIPTFKIKQVARLVHPDDPDLSEYEAKVCRYVNLMHSFFHGEFPRDYIATIYYNTEIYDSSPGREGARGTRIEP